MLCLSRQSSLAALVFDLRILRYASAYFKLSIRDTYYHFITRQCDAGDHLTILFSRHDREAASQDSVWIEGLEPASHALDMGGLQPDVMIEGGMNAACEFVYTLALRQDA